MQVEAQRHGLLPQLRVPSEEGTLPLLDHLIYLLGSDQRENTHKAKVIVLL